MNAEIHVWHVPIDEAAPEDVLSGDERARAARFIAPAARAAFVSARRALRLLLAEYSGREPASIELVTTEHGRPRLLDGSFEFNVSHSGAVALIAVASAERRIGVDVEQERERTECLKLADRFFARPEAAWLRGLPEPEVRPAFFACWTRKEAVVKGLGHGLSHPLESFVVDATAAGAAPVAGLPGWTVAPLTVPAGYAAALAWDGGPATIKELAWTT